MEATKQRLSNYSIHTTTCLLTLYSLFPPFLTPSSKKRENPFSSKSNDSISSLSFFLFPFLHFQTMEQQDWNMIGADCLVLSCCCQCLMLQLLVFFLLKLPTKLLKRTIRYIKRKFTDQMRHGGKVVGVKVARCAKEVVGCQKPRDLMKGRVDQVESSRIDGCMEEVEEVLEEFSRNGEFGFGSFWKGNNDVEVYFPTCLVKQELGCHDHVFGSFRVH